MDSHLIQYVTLDRRRSGIDLIAFLHALVILNCSLVFQVCALPFGLVQRQRALRTHRVPQAVPLRRGRGRGQPLLRPVCLQAQ